MGAPIGAGGGGENMGGVVVGEVRVMGAGGGAVMGYAAGGVGRPPCIGGVGGRPRAAGGVGGGRRAAGGGAAGGKDGDKVGETMAGAETTEAGGGEAATNGLCLHTSERAKCHTRNPPTRGGALQIHAEKTWTHHTHRTHHKQTMSRLC